MKNPTDLGRIVRLVWGLRFRSFTNTSVGPKLVTLLRHRSGAPSQTRIVVSTSFHRPCRIWFLLPRQSFIHDVSSADPLGLRALFVRTLQ